MNMIVTVLDGKDGALDICQGIECAGFIYEQGFGILSRGYVTSSGAIGWRIFLRISLYQILTLQKGNAYRPQRPLQSS